MRDRVKWISSRVRLGWIFLVMGVLLGVAGRMVEGQYPSFPYNLRIITGMGILLTGIGISYLVRYRTALRDEKAARRLTVEELDERTVIIRARAGNKAYWASAAMVYAGLMWVSLAANGGLPDLTGDFLWYFLVASVLIPFGVYLTSIIVDQQSI